MDKPEDYSTYFNEDGSSKENPYFDQQKGISDFKAMHIWSRRHNEIKYSLMSDEQRVQYRLMKENINGKMKCYL